MTPHYRGAPIDLVVDVRSRFEYWLGHLPGAVCIPVDRLPERIQERSDLSPQSRILLYCASGARSAAAANALRAAGYRSVIDAGGINAARQDVTYAA